MKRRVFICGFFNYPRGSAISNYVQYLSDALMLAGYEVHLICTINKDYSTAQCIEYHGATVTELMHETSHPLINRLLNGKLFKARFCHMLKTIGLTADDLVISASSAVIQDPILRMQKKLGFRVGAYLLEWFPKDIYDNPKAAEEADRRFHACGDLDLLLPISHHIADQFKSSRAKVLILPIMADVSEYEFIPKADGPYEFILPAMGMMKDSLESMMLALCDLTDEELSSFRFHITGVKPEQVKAILRDEWARVENTLVFHAWMQYDELIALYRRCHYLFLARDVNQMTLSNFPSKVPETMTHGIVPVCSDVGDYTQYYLTDGADSLIFRGCTREDCCRALRRALQVPFDQYQRLSRNARRCVEDRFDYHQWAETIREHIEAVFGGKQQ